MTTRLPTAAILLLLTGAAAQKCDLKCLQGAPCVSGTPDFSDHPVNQDGSPSFTPGSLTHNGVDQHCACPHGYTGVLCDVEFETCDGEHKCYNGGECIPGLLDQFGNEQLFCDCTDAVTDDGEQFVGKYCEHPSTERCDADDDHFCVNGGICNTNYPQFGNLCACAEGFDGPHCEFEEGSVPDCSLDCGEGHCVLGIRDPKDIHDIAHLFQEEGGVMHCECPPGKSGSRCEISTSSCGEHECFNGGTCQNKDKDGEVYHHCDCSTAHTETSFFAGRFCQYETTSICFDNEENGKVFCVNGGTCPNQPFEPCICSADYFGPSCEFLHESAKNDLGDTGNMIINNEDDDEMPNPEDDDDVDDEMGTETGGMTVINEDDDEIANPEDDDVDDDMGIDEDDDAMGEGEEELEEDDDRPRDDDNLDDDGEEELEEDDDRPRDDDNLDDDGEPEEDDDEVQDEDGGVAGEDCSLVCENGGKCKKGVKHAGPMTPYITGGFVSHDENYEHCVCTGDFVGLRCEQVLNRCPSGQHGCLHGGKCVAVGDEESCDCDDAVIDGVLHVAGKACEHKATDICTTGEVQPAQPRAFCVNEGICKSKVAPGQDHPGCNCVGEWIGEHCEIKAEPDDDDDAVFVGDDDEVDEDDDDDDISYDCQLKCENGGTCRKGIKHNGVISELIDGTNQFETHDDNYEHCVCKGDWVGLQCQHKLNRCPSGQHACLHGGQCVVDGDEESCDCGDASLDGSQVAGKACEHKATEICTTGNPGPTEPRSFCVNEGTCKTKISPGQPHPGCDCVGEWTGPHCEIMVSSSALAEEGSGKKSGGIIFLIILASAAVLVTMICAYCQVRKYQRRARELEEQVSLKPNTRAYSDDPKLVAAPPSRYSDNPSSGGSNSSMTSNNSYSDSELPNLATGESQHDSQGTLDDDQVYIGPPRDEDGHELHSVAIL